MIWNDGPAKHCIIECDDCGLADQVPASAELAGWLESAGWRQLSGGRHRCRHCEARSRQGRRRGPRTKRDVGRPRVPSVR